ncbi:MAG: MFS transporter [Proteobacteria bacterium]|nr:MFS transporter [Pseudomonadota bacterium]
MRAAPTRSDNAAMGHPREWKAEITAGWSLLLTATIACGTGVSSLIYYSFGLFVTPLQQAFNWSRGEVSTTLFYGSVGLVLAAPVLGWLLDRLGARRVALVAVPCFVLMLLVVSQFDGPRASFYALFFALNVAGIGTSSILYTRAVAGSFEAARGMALGITLAGPGTAAIVLPLLMQSVIADYGWRAGFVTLAVLAFAPWPLVYLWLKPRGGQSARDVGLDLPGMGRRQALGTRVFWTLAIGFAATAVACSALVVHMVPMLRDAGLAQAQAARIASLIGIGVVIGRVGIGALIDRLFAPYVAASIFIVTAGGCALLMSAGAERAPQAAFLIGFALGAEVDLLAFLTARYFGLRHYGFIYATVYACFWLSSSFGPLLAGRLFDHYGDYQATLAMVTGLMMFGALASASLPRYRAWDAQVGANSFAH